MTAPICPVSRDQVIGQPTSPTIPNIPLATDLPSALAAINSMRQALQTMHRQITINNRNVTPGHQGSNSSKPGGTSTKNSKSKQQGKWVEQSRKVKTVRVEQDGNPDNFVEFEQINNLVMADSATGETWTWNRG